MLQLRMAQLQGRLAWQRGQVHDLRVHSLADAAATCAGSLMPPALRLLLDGAGLDALLERILPLLPLRALGRLSATSRRLRALVAGLPEATWHACAEHTLRRCGAAGMQTWHCQSGVH